MWVHEGFTSYSEGLFVECQDGKAAGAKYLNGLRKNIRNDRPMIGPYDVNQEGSGDMYPKGANLLHTIRSILNDDEQWRQILRGINAEFGLKTCTSTEIENYISAQSKLNLKPVFDQYLRKTAIPTFKYQLKGKRLDYQWIADVKDFAMPIDIQINQSKSIRLKPSTKKKSIYLKDVEEAFFKVDELNFYIQTKK